MAYPGPPPGLMGQPVMIQIPKPGMGIGMKICLGLLFLCFVSSIVSAIQNYIKRKKEGNSVIVSCETGKSLNKRTNTCVTSPKLGTLNVGDYCFETNILCSTGNCYSVTGNCEATPTTTPPVTATMPSVGTNNVSVTPPSTATTIPPTNITIPMVSGGTMDMTGQIDNMLSKPIVPCAMSLALWGLKNGYKASELNTNTALRSNIMNFFTGSSLLTSIAPKTGTIVDPMYANVAQMACAPVKACTSNLIPWMKSLGYTTEVDTIMNYTGTQAAFISPFPSDKSSEFMAALTSHTLESVKQKDGTPQNATQIAMATSLNTSCKDMLPK
jgi:hypothetical protein